MASYPIKMLKDEEGTPFIPLVSTDGLYDPDGKTIQEKIQNKLEASNILAGDNITVATSGNNVTISSTGGGISNLIDNLTTETAGVGALDAHQGKVLSDAIANVPKITIVDELTSTDADKALSANQGYVLNSYINNKLPLSGGTMTGDISYAGSLSTSKIIRFLNNTADADGNGIAIGGGGITIIGGGESSTLAQASLSAYGSELLYLCNDGDVDIFTNCSSDFTSAKDFKFNSDGTIKMPNGGTVIDTVTLLDKTYPIGSIYMTVTTDSPANLFGGTWTAWGSGLVPVGVNASDSNFDTVEKTGGSPYLQSHSHTGSTSYAGSHSHSAQGYNTVPTSSGSKQVRARSRYTSDPYDDFGCSTEGNHNHSFTTDSTGAGNSGNLQPYITCYMWKRIS